MWPRPSARWPIPILRPGWVRRFRARAAELGVAFAAMAVHLGGQAVTPPAGAGRFALTAIGAAFAAAASLPGSGRLARGGPPQR